MPKVFISHSSQDRRFVEDSLVRVLQAHGVETWYSKDSIMGATRWEREILQGLRACDWFLLVMSPRSAASQWVKHEVDWAFAKRLGKIIPILVEECDSDDFHIGLAGIQHVDFRDDTTAAVRRLLAIFGVQPDRVSGLKDAVERFKKCFKEGKIAEADRIARDFPETTDQLRKLKEQMFEKLRKRIGDEIEAALKQIHELALRGDFAGARAVATRIPVLNDEARELQASMLRGVGEMEAVARLNQLVDSVLERVKAHVHKGEFALAYKVIQELPDAPPDLVELKRNVRKQVEDVEKDWQKMVAENNRIRQVFHRLGFSSVLQQLIKDNKVNESSHLEMNGLLKAVLQQLPEDIQKQINRELERGK